MNNLLTKIEDIPKNRELIIFDLDGTLVESKSEIDGKMAELFKKLLEKNRVAVIGGGKYELFQQNLVSKLNAPDKLLKKLFLFPVTATSFYRYESGEWKLVYSNNFSAEQREKVFEAFKKVFAELNYTHPEKIYGELIEDRDSQITFSALGQLAPLDLKNEWKEENEGIKIKIAEALRKLLPDMEVRVAGTTSIDVTAKGIDKEYGIHQIKERLGIPLEKMFFVGDALFPGGNDYAALNTGIPCFLVQGIEDTKKIIRHILSD